MRKNVTEIMSSPIMKKAHIAVLREEISHVQWLAKHSPSSELRAAAAMRVVTLEHELDKAANDLPQTPVRPRKRKNQAA